LLKRVSKELGITYKELAKKIDYTEANLKRSVSTNQLSKQLQTSIELYLKTIKLEPIENPIIIHPHLLQKFLKHGKDYTNLLALYSFYLYDSQQQKTNQPLTTDDFTPKGLNWASDRVKKILKEMKKLGFSIFEKYSKEISKPTIWGLYFIDNKYHSLLNP
jgi:hypothetical protein